MVEEEEGRGSTERTEESLKEVSKTFYILKKWERGLKRMDFTGVSPTNFNPRPLLMEIAYGKADT